ncbi:MAG: hypothetical protein JEZ08_04450 [Clostridiales bacterium]|nr:hypothetical protein [Clostridiales bacterium]
MAKKVIQVFTKNNVYQHIEVLKNNKKKRSKNNEFFVEGAKSISAAIENNWEIVSLIYSNERKLSKWATDMLETSSAPEHIELPYELMVELSDKNDDYSELLAVVKIPEDNLSRIKVKRNSLIVVIDRPSNHGNLGTILRSCEGLAIDGVILSGHAVDLYDVKTIRASLGTLFRVPVVRVDSPKQVGEWLDKTMGEFSDLQIIGSTSATEKMIDDVDFLKPSVLLIGNETSGLSHKFKEMCNVMVKIPMYGKITSFNVACATSMMLYEADRQKRHRKG